MKKTITLPDYQTDVETKTPEELNALFLDELKKRYWGERQLLEILPKLARLATSYELATAIEAHEKVTMHQIDRLLHIFDALEERATASRYTAMEKLLEQASDTISHPLGFNRDSAIITACRNIMSHEIAIYESLIYYANALGQKTAANFLSMAVSEERSARALFSEIVLTAIYFDEAG